ncbi:MAG TPA: hypothetical protein VFE58_05395 [Tepidisphaeraceae bacterium]|jgi:hypothetical protein|nr:hypothetical protein [Tepidisphaeraceae bacterium]
MFEPSDMSSVISGDVEAIHPFMVKADLPGRIDYVEMLARLLPKDRLNVERHITMCDMNQGPEHSALWQRIACLLMTLCDHPAKTVGRHTMQFFVPDGKYRLQVFALHDQHNGHLLVYAYNVLEEAFAAGLLERPTAGDSTTYRLSGTRELLNIELLDGKGMTPAPYFKEMLGWNRKVVRITLPTDATASQVAAVETLCGLSKAKWKM